MKKRRLVAWGLALTMGLLAGCSGQTKTETKKKQKPQKLRQPQLQM